jgi:predicted permease
MTIVSNRRLDHAHIPRTASRTMSDIVFNIFLAILIYGSGLLLWPIRRWLRRKQRVRGRFLAFVFIAQLVAYVAVACTSAFVRLGHFYYWFIFLIELNILFTVAGVIAWIRDARYKRRVQVEP